MKFLLNDEQTISQEDLKVREELTKIFKSLPKEFLSQMRHFQPQVGCYNNCGFCSKFSVCKSEYWDEKNLRNIISAIKETAKSYTDGNILLAWDRQNHRVGVVFPYLNNDAGAYPYLDKYVELCYKELGVTTRISTVGYSRHNQQLNEVHKRIANSDLIYGLGGVRLSISQYGRVWEEQNDTNSLEDYIADLANFLSIYRPYFDTFGSGSRKMCVELRYNPLVENADVFEFTYQNKYIIATGNYLFMSCEDNIQFKESFIANPYVHALDLSEKPQLFDEYNLPFQATSQEEIINYLNNNQLEFERHVEVYQFSNRDGLYYAINPQIKNEGNYGFNIYPINGTRKKSGYIVTERFLLNAIYKFKTLHGMHLRDKYENSTWEDVDKVLEICEKESTYYQERGKMEKAKYIKEHILPVITAYVTALRNASYPSDCFFDSKFTIDTGMICNLGRAKNFFKGLTNYVNEPLTPTHERNYGRHCSTMKQENLAWILACGFDNTLNIEQLDLSKTATIEGQTIYHYSVKLDGFNKTIDDKVNKYQYPGMKE